jgi:hypothetical protein
MKLAKAIPEWIIRINNLFSYNLAEIEIIKIRKLKSFVQFYESSRWTSFLNSYTIYWIPLKNQEEVSANFNNYKTVDELSRRLFQGLNPAPHCQSGTGSLIAISLNDLELKLKLLAAKDIAQIELPELAREPERWPALIHVRDEFKTERAPQIRQAYINAYRLQFDIRVERKEAAILHEAVEGVAVEVVAVRRVCRPIRIRVMRRDDLDAPAGFRDAVKL